jgi:hypothetical protein
MTRQQVRYDFIDNRVRYDLSTTGFVIRRLYRQIGFDMTLIDNRVRLHHWSTTDSWKRRGRTFEHTENKERSGESMNSAWTFGWIGTLDRKDQ